ncbi:amino acid ABC transporter permease [Phyllobacterium zundukense]|uniref:Amino acid ABC transporter permease n=1 Tax=Phyllobacterium zundukense TaxID=1867719 RepID=A0A2N9W0J4_9HYPH|nr:amino acid ABC transporter permease [Phyllobacterium zundukense]ATU95487.1 amino acid ABC transporter permease [Phyllobacterium zundukense]PIO45262.1 amino acid ABC transporter permease [Phyllobacterium zundukense]
MNYAFIISLLEGLFGTVILSMLTFIFGGILGFIIALARISPVAVISRGTSVYIEILQGMPLLVLMGLCFYGPGIFGYDSLSPLQAATFALTLYSSAYLGEIWRGCLQSVAKPQWEAAECLGISRWHRMRHVILPQALRIATPPTVGFMVQIIKNTSIASLVVGYAELSYNAKIINNSTFQPFLYFGIAALMYFAICYPLSVQSRVLERKLNVANR